MTLGDAKVVTGGIQVTWNEADGAAKYKVYRKDAANTVSGVERATVSFMTQKMKVEFAEGADPHATMENVLSACKKVEDDCEIFDI